jgi:isopenicillin N synthase-like dioxygenase
MTDDPHSIPVIDLAAFLQDRRDADAVVAEIRQACCEFGFFYAVGHGVDEDLQSRLEGLSRQFFALDLETKLQISMEHGGRAWRGYFPVGAELTLGRPDQKEGLYFGAELDADHPKVQAGVPLHGRNLFPSLAGFRDVVLEYLQAMTELGHLLMEAMALSLGLDSSYFADRYTRDPLILFRIFHYPPQSPEALADASMWGVGEHTDYGLLTILRQDAAGGLQIKSGGRWIDAPPIPGSFVCNIGDMLDRMTGGVYRSTPHRVRNAGAAGRLSFPFFFDPNFDAQVEPIDPRRIIQEDKDERWDKGSVHELSGTYGDYVLQKVAKVFPDLRRETR